MPSILGKILKNKLIGLIVLTVGCAIEILIITFKSLFYKKQKYEYRPEIYSNPEHLRFEKATTSKLPQKLGDILQDDTFLKIECDWITFHGLRAIVVKNTLLDIRTGYVGVPKDNFLHGRLHDEHVPELMPYIDDITRNPLGKRSQVILLKYQPNVASMIMIFDVVNGVTHNCGGIGSKHPVESDLWWLTFKCIRLEFVQTDGVQNISIEPIGDLELCIDECENLASQIRNAEFRYKEMEKKISDQIEEMTRNQ